MVRPPKPRLTTTGRWALCCSLCSHALLPRSNNVQRSIGTEKRRQVGALGWFFGSVSEDPKLSAFDEPRDVPALQCPTGRPAPTKPARHSPRQEISGPRQCESGWDSGKLCRQPWEPRWWRTKTVVPLCCAVSVVGGRWDGTRVGGAAGCRSAMTGVGLNCRDQNSCRQRCRTVGSSQHR